MKRILAIGRVRNGGAVEITAPTLEERLAMQMERNAQVIERNRATLAEIDAMHADLDALLAGKPVGYKLTAAQLAELDDEQPGDEYRWLW